MENVFQNGQKINVQNRFCQNSLCKRGREKAHLYHSAAKVGKNCKNVRSIRFLHILWKLHKGFFLL
jgi:hypothetical protein